MQPDGCQWLSSVEEVKHYWKYLSKTKFAKYSEGGSDITGSVIIP
jgi:hypothetical protein